MARGSTLATIVSMVKAELFLDDSAEVSPGGDATIKVQIATQQKWLALKHHWPFLDLESTVSLVAGTRHYAFPSSPNTLELGKAVEAHCYFGELWNEVDYGISPEHYNSLNPALDQRCDPVTRWQMINVGGVLKFEVWPLPATAMTFRFRGQRVLGALTSDAHTADLDDLLIAQFTAAKLATRMKGADAQALLSQALDTLRELRRGYPSEMVSFNTGGTKVPPRDWQRPTVATMITP